LSKEQIYIVPGNHDVQRDVDTSDRNVSRLLHALRSGSEKLDTVWLYKEDQLLLSRRQQNFLDFSAAFGPRRDNNLFWTHRLPLKTGLVIRIAGLNTALLCSGDDDYKKLELGNEQLVKSLLHPPIGGADLTILLSHHPFDWLRDEAGCLHMARRHA